MVGSARRSGLWFGGAATLVAAAVVTVGWLTGLRTVLYAALLSLAVGAFLPFVLVAGALFVVMVATIVMGFVAGDGGTVPPDGAEVIVHGGAWLVPRYYRFLARRRHPVFWGVGAGVLVGGLLLWGLLALFVIPGETRTAETLASARVGLEQVRRDRGAFPDSGPDGRLTGAALGRSGDPGALVDGFGRPLVYRVSGPRWLASWTLRSNGFDGRPSDDDLCVSGATRLGRWVSALAEVAEDLSTADRLAGLQALRCPVE